MGKVHIDRQSSIIDGVKFKNTHSGQKRAYGDMFYEYEIESDLPADDVERICSTKVYEAISKSVWQADYRKPGCSMSDAFRPHYTFTSRGPGKWFYQVCLLYTD